MNLSCIGLFGFLGECFPKSRVQFGSPYNKDCNMLGSTLGPPVDANSMREAGRCGGGGGEKEEERRRTTGAAIGRRTTPNPKLRGT